MANVVAAATVYSLMDLAGAACPRVLPAKRGRRKARMDSAGAVSVCEGGTGVVPPSVTSSHLVVPPAKKKKSTKGAQARRWCFTDNVLETEIAASVFEADKEAILRGRDNGVVRCACAQLEVAPKTGQEHVQGYVALAGCSMRMKAFKVFIGRDTIHLESAKATDGENLGYCNKTESRMVDTVPWAIGLFDRCPGYRSDIEAAYQLARSGACIGELQDAYPGVVTRHYSAFEKTVCRMAAKTVTPRAFPKVFCLWGVSGGGKSQDAIHLANRLGFSDSVYTKSCTLRTWPFYTGQKYVVFNEFHGDHDGQAMSYQDMCELCDAGVYRGDVKLQSPVVVQAEVIVICSNTDFNEWKWRSIPQKYDFGPGGHSGAYIEKMRAESPFTRRILQGGGFVQYRETWAERAAKQTTVLHADLECLLASVQVTA